MATKYNGWTNRVTWVIALWIGNDQGLYNEVYELCHGLRSKFQRADVLKSLFDAKRLELAAVEGMWADLITHALVDVDWVEIAENHFDDEELYGARGE